MTQKKGAVIDSLMKGKQCHPRREQFNTIIGRNQKGAVYVYTLCILYFISDHVPYTYSITTLQLPLAVDILVLALALTAC